MQYLHGLKLYDTPRKGIFRIDTNEYKSTEGWMYEQQECKIIGEDDYCYITKTFRTTSFILRPDIPPLTGNLIYGIGIHKDMFVKWLETQLELF